MKRKDEEFCREVFTKFLATASSPGEDVLWHEVPQAKEPPDFFLDLGSCRFAVEVTSLMDSEIVGGQELQSVAAETRILRFVARLEQEAKAAGLLSGLYVLSVRAIPDFPGQFNVIRDAVFDYLRSTRDQKASAGELLLREERGWLRIQKWGNHRDSLAPTVHLPAKWEGQIEEDICKLLLNAVEDKREKLKLVGDPKILLLLDRYHYAGARHWALAAESISFAGFHTVARIWQDEPAQILYSLKREWGSR